MNDAHDHGKNAPRMVRVFLSSTFRDMQAERDELVKMVFPELERRLARRMVGFVPVDLRWGVTAEEAERGDALTVCLAEIDRSYPYFICLLGERYGWIPPDELAAEQEGKSITEMEIRHAALDRKDRQEYALFYFRDQNASSRVEEELRPRPDYAPEPPSSAQKLVRLKEHINQRGFFLREGYPDERTVGQWILEDLWKILDRQFPQETAPTEQERRRLENEAFAAARTKIYIPRESSYRRIDEAVEKSSAPLFLTGPSGRGKSALLANWAAGYRRRHPGHFVSENFVGSDPDSSDYVMLLRGIMIQIQELLGLQGERDNVGDKEAGDDIPTDPNEVVAAFPRWLAKAGGGRRFVIIIDALNQLNDKDNALDLAWLPKEYPDSIRLVVSTLPGRPERVLEERGWATFEVEPLTPSEIEQFIDLSLGHYGKKLNKRQCNRIANTPQAANPLFLRTLLEELRLFGVYEGIDQRIDAYLAAPSVGGLFSLVLARMESDYERDRPGLTRDVMSLIWASRRGLSETEILELVGDGSKPLPHAYWSSLYLALVESLVNRSGLLTFFHDFLRQAVERRYLPDDAGKEAARRKLTGYFLSMENGPRKVDEAPWLLFQLHDWDRLHLLLADPEILAPLWDADSLAVRSYWSAIERETGHRMEETYRPVIAQPEQYANAVWSVASLFEETGHSLLAGPLLRFLALRYREENDEVNLAGALGNYANHLYMTGDREAALAAYEEAEAIYRRREDRIGLQRVMGNRGVILQDQGEMAEAYALFKEKETLCRTLGYRDGLIRALGAQAVIEQAWGKWELSQSLLKEQERLCREAGDLDQLQVSLNNQAVALQAFGDIEEAMSLYRETERISRSLGDRQGIQRSLANQAALLLDQGKPDAAGPLFEETVRLCREMDYASGLQNGLGGMALAALRQGRLDDALRASHEQIAICRKNDETGDLARALGARGAILQEAKNVEEAMACYREEADLCRRTGDKEALAVSLAAQATLAQRNGDDAEALALLDEEINARRTLNDPEQMVNAMNNRASLLLELGDTDQAEPILREAESVSRGNGLKKALRRSLGLTATLMRQRGTEDGLLAFLEEESALAEEIGEKDALQVNLGMQAALYQARGQIDAAVDRLVRKERLCRELGSVEGLIVALFNQASIRIKEKRDLDEALRQAAEAASLAGQGDFGRYREKIGAMIAWLRQEAG
jgi:tetratricopeptide (TPR) repeat protein